MRKTWYFRPNDPTNKSWAAIEAEEDKVPELARQLNERGMGTWRPATSQEVFFYELTKPRWSVVHFVLYIGLVLALDVILRGI